MRPSSSRRPAPSFDTLQVTAIALFAAAAAMTFVLLLALSSAPDRNALGARVAELPATALSAVGSATDFLGGTAAVAALTIIAGLLLYAARSFAVGWARRSRRRSRETGSGATTSG